MISQSDSREGVTRQKQLTASCECGGVSFVVVGQPRAVVNCHCSQCLKTHGHIAAYTNAEEQDLKFLSDRTLTWYRSSNSAQRGFCNACGASIFWKRDDASDISIAAGMVDRPSGLATAGHIFVDSKGDYYEIGDELPKHAEGGAAF